MDKKNYDKKLIALFDIVGSYFVDTFYNSLYLKSKDVFISGRTQSLTEAYRGVTISYLKGLSTRIDLYRQIIKKLHEYYQRTIGRTSGVFTDFEDVFLSKFIPKDYYENFTSQDKDKTLHDIIIRSVSELIELILKDHNMQKIIDDHMNKSNVVFLQQNMVNIHTRIREEYYSKFVTEIINDDKSAIPTALYNKLKHALKDETELRITAEADRDKAINMCTMLMNNNKSLQQQLASCDINTKKPVDDKIVDELNSRLVDVNGKLNDANGKLAKARSELKEYQQKYEDCRYELKLMKEKINEQMLAEPVSFAETKKDSLANYSANELANPGAVEVEMEGRDESTDGSIYDEGQSITFDENNW